MPRLCKPDNQPLREALNAPDGFIISLHRQYIERVRDMYPHTVTFRELIDESTCVLYALGLRNERTCRAIALSFNRKIFAGKAFMDWLVKGRLTEIEKPKESCLALYFSGGAWQHVRVVSAEGRIVSQWGAFPVYEHNVCELPARYGDQVQYFEIPALGEALRLFLEYAKTRGVSASELAKAIKA